MIRRRGLYTNFIAFMCVVTVLVFVPGCASSDESAIDDAGQTETSSEEELAKDDSADGRKSTKTATATTEADEQTERTSEAETETASTQAVTMAATAATQAMEAGTEVATQVTEDLATSDTDTQSGELAASEELTEEVQRDPRVDEVIALINAERTAAGVAAVSYDPTLTTMAQVRATENADNDFFVVENDKHKRPDGRNASSICLDYGVYGHFGEVMGRYQTTPQEIVEGWHNSSTHYECMTNAIYTRVGVGIATDSAGRLYWVAIFMD